MPARMSHELTLSTGASMDGATMTTTWWNRRTRQRALITSAAMLDRLLGGLRDGESLTLALCVERGGSDRGRRRPTLERWMTALRLGARVCVLDPTAIDGPVREIRGSHDLTCYFDEAAGFAYVEVC
jgi:hypothetical protein